MPSVISGDANVSATEFGFLDGVTSGLQSQIDSKLNLAGGKILQIVRATDSTDRSTTSTSSSDVTGMSVTITPQKSDSGILLIASFLSRAQSTVTVELRSRVIITDSSNNAVSGAQDSVWGPSIGFSFSGTATFDAQTQLWGYATPATTSAVTYKLRFNVQSASTTLRLVNSAVTGQLYAIEVSA